MSAQEVIARAMFERHAPHSGFGGYARYTLPQWEDEGVGLRQRWLDDAAAILAALDAAPLETRLALARRLAGDAHAVVPVEPTAKMEMAGGQSIMDEYRRRKNCETARELAENLDTQTIWRAMCAAAREDQR